MLRKFKTLAVAALGFGGLFCAANDANAQAYISGSLGVFAPDDVASSAGLLSGRAELDNGLAANLAVGYRLAPSFRVDAEFGYYNSSLNKMSIAGFGSVPFNGADLDFFVATANAYYDIRTGSMFTPYLGGGVGIAHEELSNFSVGGTSFTGTDADNFAWQLEAGVAIDVSPNLAIVPAYRYLHINDGGSSGGVNTDDTVAHIFKVGIRYSF